MTLQACQASDTAIPSSVTRTPRHVVAIGNTHAVRTQSRSPSAQRIIPSPAAESPGAPSAAQLTAGSQEELTRLRYALGDLACRAVVRGLDGSVVPLAGAAEASWLERSEQALQLSAAISDEQGCTVAALELMFGEPGYSRCTEQLLRGLLATTARAISERWFRLQFLPFWILGAQRIDDASRKILLAMDPHQRIVGADFAARQFLHACDKGFGPHLTLEMLFRRESPPSPARRHLDELATLTSFIDGTSWSGLITPPDPCANHAACGERALLHARPRFCHRLLASSQPREERGGLPGRMLRRIEDYIDAHLDSPLNVEQLAGTLGISVSHFARCFRHSVGLTPHEYVMRTRLSHAERLLRETDLSLAEIALTTGFSDQSHFTRRFHQLAGMPPRLFRREHR